VSRLDQRPRPAAGDPLAVFGVLAGDAPGLGGPEDVAEIRRAVAAMRRGHRLASGPPRRRLGSAAEWRRAAAVAVLALGLLSLAAGGWRRAAEGGGEPAAAVPAAAVATPAGPASARGDEWSRRPVFEGLDRPRSASVYELAGEELDVVMVVDETLDV
jgi:hypothetical protein